MVLVYLFKNLFFNIFLFFKHWYYDASLYFYGNLLKTISNLERSFAVRMNLHFIFSPLYQERNFIGYVLGFVARSFRVFFGGLFYLILLILFSGIFLLWSLVPLFLLYKIFYG